MNNVQNTNGSSNYKYGFWINQKAVNDWLLSSGKNLITVNELYVLCYIICIWNKPNGLVTETKNGIKYIFLNDKVIFDNLIFLEIEKRQLKNYIAKFEELKLISRFTRNKNERFITVNPLLIEYYFKNIK